MPSLRPLHVFSIFNAALLSLACSSAVSGSSPTPAAAQSATGHERQEQSQGGQVPTSDGEARLDAQTQLDAQTTSEETGADVDPGPDACPADMVLVEGEYCTHIDNPNQPDEHGNTRGAGGKDVEVIERECKKEWFAPQNNKRVCEEFATAGKCTGKMIKKRFCIDRYAWPNKKGFKPEVMNRFHQAQVKCAAVDKRLCTESEWTFSCEGEKMKPFPYGYVRDTTKCHGDEEWDSPNMMKVAQRDKKELRRLYKGKPSGQEQCKSDFGVYDLPGNTDEVVASETFESGWRGKYDSVHTGGPWYKGVRNQCRPKIYTHDEGFYYYFLSFRCCADADAKVVDPLTPKQKEQGWDMKRVERTAGITVAEMKKLLEKKKSDPTCGCTTTKCRTFCGTLLGDDFQTAPSERGAPSQGREGSKGSSGPATKKK